MGRLLRRVSSLLFDAYHLREDGNVSYVERIDQALIGPKSINSL